MRGLTVYTKCASPRFSRSVDLPLRVAVGLSRLAVQPLLSSLLLGSLLRLLLLLQAQRGITHCAPHGTTKRQTNQLSTAVDALSHPLPPRYPTLSTLEWRQ